MRRAGIAIVLVCLFNILAPRCAAGDPDGEDGSFESKGQFYDVRSLTGIRRESSLTSTAIHAEDRRVDDIRISLSTDRSWLAIRYNRRKSGERAAFFIDSFMRGFPARFTAGYLVPDFGLGLTYSPVETDYIPTAGFSIRDYRHFVRRTSFYGMSIRGGAVTLGAGPGRLILFAGQPGEWREVRYISGEYILSGVRLEYAGEVIRAGITVSGSGEARCTGIDLLRRRKRSAAGLEIAVDEDGQVSFMTGIRNSSDGTSFGLRIYGGRYGGSTILARILSASPVDMKGVAGLLLYLDRRAGSMLRLAGAAGASVSVTGDKSIFRDEYRVELSSRIRTLRLRASYSGRLVLEEDMIPYPPAARFETSRSSSLNILIKADLNCLMSCRLSLRFPDGSRGRGRAASLHVDAGSTESPARLTAVATLYHAVEGNPAIYVYEPVLRGGYPWHRYGGRGIRLTFLGSVRVAGSLVSARFYGVGRIDAGADLQILREF